MPEQAIVTIRDKQWECQVASTPAELAAGLSGVPSIPPGTGMLFILPQEQIVTVTAENMLFPLSVIFISDNLQVTEVVLLLAPGDDGTTSLPCRYFLEVNVGEADDIAPGDPVNIELTEGPTAPTADWMVPVVTLAGVVMIGAMMVNMGKTMTEALFGKPKEKPLIYGPRGEQLLPQTGLSRHPSSEEEATFPVEARKDLAFCKHMWDLEKTMGRPLTRQEVTQKWGEWKALRYRLKSEDERKLAHSLKYGTEELPERGKGLQSTSHESVELLAASGKYIPQTVRSGYYWTAINKDTGEIVESVTPHTSSGRALRGGKAFVSRHWRGDKALVEVWRQPFRYSEIYTERLKIEPVTSEIVTPDKSVAVIPTEPRRPRREDELEFLPDSPEFLAYTIEDIGYRDKLDNAFLQAIARAKGGKM